MNMNNSNEVKRSLWRTVSVEPVMFMYMFAFMLTTVVEESFFVNKACRINLGLPANICDNINYENNTETKKKVQVIVSNFRQYEGIALHAVPVLLALLLGAWSDKHGRKLPMLLGLAGSLFYAIMIIVNTLQDWPLEVVLYTATFPSAITGSSLAVFLAAFTYVADITTAKQRTQRVTFLEVAYLIPMPTGVAIGSYLFTNVVNESYTLMFCIHAALLVVAIIYTLFTMEMKINESPLIDGPMVVNSDSYDTSNSCSIFDIWNWNIVIDSFKTVFRKRTENRRKYLILVILAMGLYTFQRDEKHMVYLYTQLKFHWSVATYSHFRTYQSTLFVLGLLIGVPMITKAFALPDTIVVVVGSAAHAIARVVFATAQQPSFFYIGASVAAFGPLVAPVLRSITSKLVPPSERGKAFSMLTVADTSVPVISAAIYTQVYNATINTMPSTFFWITVVTQLLVCSIGLYVHYSLGGKIIEQAEDPKQQEPSISNLPEDSIENILN
ncbi:putative peptidoglycan muropeptide transporter SLC46 isoform X2 [Lycorma delicatula]|uniref:putative peptidoglycan muropeptide transporter SLC46 isoform X2 n=1 Tax=Lycorma delicatula TaxID=130591 RepID=UPI003F514A3D